LSRLTDEKNLVRQNVQPGGLFNAPDANVPSMVCGKTQGMENSIDVQVAVKNNGAELLLAGTAIHIELEKDGMILPLLDTATTVDLLPGQFEALDLTIMLPMNAPSPPYVVRAIVDPDNAINECVEDNNSGEASCVVVQ